MKTKTKYLIALLSVIEHLFGLLRSLYHLVFAKWIYNEHGQYNRKNFLDRISDWALHKSVKIFFKIEEPKTPVDTNQSIH